MTCVALTNEWWNKIYRNKIYQSYNKARMQKRYVTEAVERFYRTKLIDCI